MPARVYLSYAPSDEAFAARLRDDLRAAGEDVETSAPELDTIDLTTSDSMSRINSTLAERDVAIAVLSPDALSSARVNRELYIATGRATTGAMRRPLIVTARPVSSALPINWSHPRDYDASGDYGAALPRIVSAVDGTENPKPSGFAALVDGNGFSPQAIWTRFGVRGTAIVISALIAILSFGMAWFSVGISCGGDQGCSLGPAVIAPGPNNVDGYFLASGKRINVSTGTAKLENPGVKIVNGYAGNDGTFDPHLPVSVLDGTQTVVVNNQLTFTVLPALSFSFESLRFFLPLAIIFLLMPILVAVLGLRMVLAKILVVIPVLLELILLVVYIAAAPEAFHSSELVHFAPGPGVGTWLAFLFTIVAISFALSMPTKPPTQRV